MRMLIDNFRKKVKVPKKGSKIIWHYYIYVFSVKSYLLHFFFVYFYIKPDNSHLAGTCSLLVTGYFYTINTFIFDGSFINVSLKAQQYVFCLTLHAKFKYTTQNIFFILIEVHKLSVFQTFANNRPKFARSRLSRHSPSLAFKHRIRLESCSNYWDITDNRRWNINKNAALEAANFVFVKA
jgi:hypothetical protein